MKYNKLLWKMKVNQLLIRLGLREPDPIWLQCAWTVLILNIPINPMSVSGNSNKWYKLYIRW